MLRKIALLLLLSTQLYAQAMITKVINLNYKSADQVITLVKPLLQPGEQISGSGQTLVVKLTPNTLTQLRSVLHQIDQPPVTFEIAVHQDGPNWLSSQNSNVISYTTPSRINQQQSQAVRVTSGEAAFVSTGKEEPIVTGVGVGWFTGVTYQQKQVQKGFYIVPLLQGNQVKLSIRQVREQDNMDMGQRFDNQNVMTTVMVPLNKWVSLSSAEGVQTSTSSTMVYTAGNQFSQNSTLYIKVTVVK